MLLIIVLLIIIQIKKTDDNDGQGDVCDPDPIVEFNITIIKENAKLGVITGDVSSTCLMVVKLAP